MEAVRAHNPTAVTLDLGLPDIDGFEVVRQLRLLSDAYIVMLTARAEELDTLMGLEAGADDYITKPFLSRELRARISAMLRHPRSGKETPPPAPRSPLRWHRLPHLAHRESPHLRPWRLRPTDAAAAAGAPVDVAGEERIYCRSA